MSSAAKDGRRSTAAIGAAVGLAVALTSVVVVAWAGTDIPAWDEWNVHGGRLFPAWRDGSLSWADLFRAHNEHRIVWTHVTAVGLFALNGQWDPLMQLLFGAGVRGVAAGVLAGCIARLTDRGGWMAAVVTVAYLPAVAWHNVLWAFQSQVFFAVAFGVASAALLARERSPLATRLAGLAIGGAGLLAMGPVALLPVALLVWAGLLSWERRTPVWGAIWPAGLLLAGAFLLREHVPEHDSLRAVTISDGARAAGRALAWPHTAQPVAALVMQLPFVALLLQRLRGRHPRARGEDFILVLGGWSVLIGLAAAAMRGGSAEWLFGTPSRYADFLALQPVVNAWCAAELLRHVAGDRRRIALACAGGWAAFVLVGFVGLNAEGLRKAIGPRARSHDGLVDVMRTFQHTGDARVFENVARLILPHPDPESIRRVLADPRMAGALPPSLQPDQPRGPLTRAARGLMRRD